mgnify:CR=1 FL=1
MTLDELYASFPGNIEVDYFMFEHAESLSAPIGNGYVIAIDPTKIRSSVDEKEKAAHEGGHCYTGSFYSPGEDFFMRQRYENRADAWAIKKLVPKDEFERAISTGYTDPWQLAEYFDVSCEFMHKAITFYSK